MIIHTAHKSFAARSPDFVTKEAIAKLRMEN